MSLALVVFSCLIPSIIPKASHQYYWRDYRGFIPNDAFAGVDNLYVAQIVVDWQMPGTFNARTGEAYTVRINKVTVDAKIKLLCDKNIENFVWEKVNAYQLIGSKLNDLVIGGFEQSSTLYIGKAFHEGQWKIGKVFPPTHEYRGLRIWKEHSGRYVTDTFEVLVYNNRLDANHVCNCTIRKTV